MADSGGCFLHGVASGDPLTDRVVIWSRITTPGGAPATTDWVMARDRELRDVVGSGTAPAAAEHDHTV